MSKHTKIFIIIFCLAVILFLLKEGARAPASLLGFILFVAALVERVMSIRILNRAYKQYDGKDVSNNAQMSRKEALEVLELDESASEDDIKKAYKRLIAKIHPDQGGSKYLAAKINQARDVLIKKKRTHD